MCKRIRIFFLIGIMRCWYCVSYINVGIFMLASPMLRVANVSDINRFNVRDVNRGSFNTYMNVHDSSRILNWLRMTTESLDQSDEG